MKRAVKEWAGREGEAVPRRVRLRVFDRDGGCCKSCGRKITARDTWETDHKIALINGGMNHEANLQTLCSWCHKPKTAEDVKEKSITYRKRCKMLGIKSENKRPVPGSKASPFKAQYNRQTGRFETVWRDDP